MSTECVAAVRATEWMSELWFFGLAIGPAQQSVLLNSSHHTSPTITCAQRSHRETRHLAMDLTALPDPIAKRKRAIRTASCPPAGHITISTAQRALAASR
ncbi:hypothetical protein PSPO01_15463 [Paraphaeosphaeria sporulosa]